MPKWKLKIKGSGTPPAVPSGSASNFNSPDAQYGGEANGRLSGYPHSGRPPGAPSGPSTSQGTVKRRAHFPMPRSSRNVGRTIKTREK